MIWPFKCDIRNAGLLESGGDPPNVTFVPLKGGYHSYSILLDPYISHYYLYIKLNYVEIPHIPQIPPIRILPILRISANSAIFGFSDSANSAILRI